MILRISLSMSILLAALQTLCAQTPNASSGFFGSWIVKDVLCSDCGERILTEKGTVIELARTRIRNALGEDCPRDPGYDSLKEMSGREVIARYGKRWPRPVKRAALKHEKVRYGFITCGGVNLMQILFVSDERAFYFFEGGIAFELFLETFRGQPS